MSGKAIFRTYRRRIIVLVLLLLAAVGIYSTTQSSEPDYYRVVILSDLHLPVREREVAEAKRDGIIRSKREIVEDVNGWPDVSCIVALGDITAQFGNAEEYSYAKDYLKKFTKPVYPITGNHDYIYADSFSEKGRFVLGNSSSREMKLQRFKSSFNQKDLFYSKQLGKYRLIFLSVDALDSRYLTEISAAQLSWLRQELTDNKLKPTIIFFHAPLKGTLTSDHKLVDSPSFFAQPEKELREIIEDNPQIVLWVAGHVHVSPRSPSFSSPVNVYNQKLLTLHNTDLDRENAWTNSLYLYQDKIVIKTFDHKRKEWMELERAVNCPPTSK